MDAAVAADMFEEFDPESHQGAQFQPSVNERGHPEAAAGSAPFDALTRLSDELRRVAEEVDAIDRRDAAQHGVLKGEIAHLVRRVARLEAIPRPRPLR